MYTCKVGRHSRNLQGVQKMGHNKGWGKDVGGDYKVELTFQGRVGIS